MSKIHLSLMVKLKNFYSVTELSDKLGVGQTAAPSERGKRKVKRDLKPDH